MTLMEIIFAAQHAVNTQRNPDLTAFRNAVDPVLEALKGYSIGSETVDSIEIDDESVYINTSYTVKGWDDHDSYTIPMAFIEADDPVFAAKLHRANLAVDIASMQLDSALNSVDQAQKALAVANEQLATLIKE